MDPQADARMPASPSLPPGSAAHADAQQVERAVQHYLRALESEPTQLEPLHKLDAMLSARSEYERLETILALHAKALREVDGVDLAALGGIYSRLGQLRAERATHGSQEDIDGAIEAYDQALDLAPSSDTILALGQLYEQRDHEGDAEQAAELFYTLGDVLGDVEGLPMVERALQCVPSHDAAMELLERYVPQEHSVRLRTYWEAYIAHSDNEAGKEMRRQSLARVIRQASMSGDAHERSPTLVGFGLPIRSTFPPNGPGAIGPGAIGPGAKAAALRAQSVPPPQEAAAEPIAAVTPEAPVAAVALEASPALVAGVPPESPPEPIAAAAPEAPHAPLSEATPEATPLQQAAPLAASGPAALAAQLRARSSVVSAPPAAQATPVAAALPARAQEKRSSSPGMAAPPAIGAAASSVSATVVAERAQAVADSAAPAKRGNTARWLIAAAIVVGGSVAALLMTRSRPSPAPLPPASRVEAPAPVAPVPTLPLEAVAAPKPAAVAPTTAPSPTSAPARAFVAGKPRVRGGRLSPAQIALALQDSASELQRCYDKALTRKPSLAGKLTFAWSIDKAGRPQRVRKQSSTLTDAPLLGCSIAAIKQARFPKARPKAAQVTWPLTYPKP